MSAQQQNSFLSLNGGTLITNKKQITLNLEFPYAREVFIATDAESAYGKWEELKTPHPFTLEGADGNYVLNIKFRNYYKKETDWIVKAVTLDTLAPEISLNASVGNLTATTDAQFDIMATDGVSGIANIYCHLDGEESKICSDSIKYTDLANGPHVFSAHALDKAGNPSVVKKHEWTIDTVAPKIILSQKPDQYSKENTATFAFADSDAGTSPTRFSCQLDSAEAAMCTSPLSLTDLAKGSHSLKISAADEVGNSVTQTYSWFIDPDKPTLNFVKTPAKNGQAEQVEFQFEFSDGDSGSGVQQVLCQLNNGTASACTSPIKVDVNSGKHIFSVTVTDKAMNAAIISYAFEIDRTAPTIMAVNKPADFHNSTTAIIGFEIKDENDEQVNSSCRLDEESVTACYGGRTYSRLGQGPHQVEVKAWDKAGNTNTQVFKFFVDSIAPDLPEVNRVSENGLLSSDVKFEFSSVDTGSGIAFYICQVDSKPEEFCRSGKDYVDLDLGDHYFTVSATDKAGNRSSKKTIGFRVNKLKPGGRPEPIKPIEPIEP